MATEMGGVDNVRNNYQTSSFEPTKAAREVFDQLEVLIKEINNAIDKKQKEDALKKLEDLGNQVKMMLVDVKTSNKQLEEAQMKIDNAIRQAAGGI